MTENYKQGTETRERILDAAEVLFAAHGFEATSMRMITGLANVNLAAVNYHFGSKDALIQEVFRRRLTGLNQRRMSALEEAERAAAGSTVKPSRIVEIFFGMPLVMAAEADPAGATFMRLLGRTYTEPNEFVRRFLAEEYSEVVERFMGALYQAIPDVPRDEILWRFHFMMGAMSYAIAGTDALRLFGGELNDTDPERMLPRLMSFLLGGLRAPLPGLQAAGAARDAA
ncbi:TetR/AcrR family transcriptional regulator [Nitrogeniibacter aestuarii]|uniref:TetR/AcrR family transcriptional regulator n=1 Tax=Nitrogeniibacter aestuarii TaxID=2815343 RepID=UPI001D11F05E|nr:TetR/AcrR family transcriptional regulator [Nitrogeniibacter aestuarii]